MMTNVWVAVEPMPLLANTVIWYLPVAVGVPMMMAARSF